MTIEPEPLRTVIAAAQYGSFRRAAAALDIKQSTLSRRVRRLEEYLGVSLFERSSGGVHVTAVGGNVVRMAVRLLEQMDRMVSIARSADRNGTDDIAIGVSMSLSAGKLRTVLARYTQVSPTVRIFLAERSRTRLLDDLRRGDLDVAIVVGQAQDHDGPSMPLWSERVLVVLPTGHRLTSGGEIHWADLKGEAFLLGRRAPGPDLRNIIMLKLSTPGEMPHVESWDVGTESIMAMLGTGDRISLHCESGATPAYPGVVYRDVSDASGPCRVAFTACWNDGNKNPSLARFVDLLREHQPQTPIT
jgi:DNA-binding transcriptional LysR family regulator